MILVVDNYDSFTYNLAQALESLGVRCEVALHDAIDVAAARALAPDGVLISPGPCAPDDAGVTLELLRELAGALPILGVCLGHQAIGAALGGRIVRAKTQMHGKTDVITNDQRGVHAGLPREFTVIRYHSLVIEQATRPEVLEITSTSQDDEIMGVRHRELAGTKTPLEGVQFHPESILTEHGHAMLRNFVRMADRA